MSNEIEVRNTIRGIDQFAYHDAKIFAAHTGDTLGEVVSEAIRRYIYDFETIELVDGWLDDTLSVIETDNLDKAKIREWFSRRIDNSDEDSGHD